MPDPTPERIAAALALAEAAERYWPYPKGTEGPLAAAIVAYQATAPKLRTRAEVDAEIGLRLRSLNPEMLRRAGYDTLAKLAGEPLALEPSEELSAIDGCLCTRCKLARGEAVDE